MDKVLECVKEKQEDRIFKLDETDKGESQHFLEEGIPKDGQQSENIAHKNCQD